MRKLLFAVLILSCYAFGQATIGGPVIFGAGAPSNPCANGTVYVRTDIANASYYCLSGVWQAAGSATAQSPVIVASSATPSFDASTGSLFQITLTQNATASLVNATSGQNIGFLVCQDSIGGRTWTWFPQASGQLSGFSTQPNVCVLATGYFIGSTYYIQSYTQVATPGEATLTITPAGTGTGTTVSSPSGLNCPGTCTASFPIGTVITLTATPATGSTWTSASGGGCTTQICTFTLTNNTTVTETFGGTSTVFSVTLTETGAGAGTVTSSPAGINCPGTCSANFASGANIVLTAAPNGTSQTGTWTGCTTFSGNTCNINSIAANTAVTVTFNTVGAISFVQSADGATASGSNVNIAFPNSQAQGDFNVLVIGWNDKTHTISSVTDSAGNTYSVACASTQHPSSSISQAVYYASNIASGANTVTVTFSGTPTGPDVRVLEYSGISATGTIDSSCSTATSATPSVPSVTTTFSNDLLIVGDTTTGGITGVGSGFTQRMFVTATDDDVQDKLGAAAATYSPSISFTGGNISQLVAFEGQSGSSSGCSPAFGNFTSTSQPANCWTPYIATSPFNSAVPATASSACPSGASGGHPCFAQSSSTWISTITTQGGSSFASGNYGVSTPYPNVNEFGHDVFWAQPTDGWYKLTNVSGSFCNGNNLILRIPSVARPTGGSDSHMDIVDQSAGTETACDAFPKSLIPLPAGGTQASPTVLNVGGAGCGQNNIKTTIGANPGTTGWCAPTSSFGDLAGSIRYEELSAGAINHALFVVVKGGGSAVTQVYPGQTGGVGATGTTEPPIGSLLWLDVSCSTINAISDIPAYVKTVLCAMNKYGAYVGDTGNPNGIAIHYQSDNTYTAYGLTGKMASFWAGNSSVKYNGSTNSYFVSISSGTTVTQSWWNTHLHVLDPCVAKQMAGVAGGCSP